MVELEEYKRFEIWRDKKLLLTLNMNMFNFVIDDSFNDYIDSIHLI